MASVPSLPNSIFKLRAVRFLSGYSGLLVSGLIFRDHWASCEFLCRHEEFQSLRLFVSPERSQVSSTLKDQVERDQTFEKNILNQDCSQHLQGEHKSPVPLDEVSQDPAVQVEKGDEEDGLVESHHVVLDGPGSDQFSIFLPINAYRADQRDE